MEKRETNLKDGEALIPDEGEEEARGDDHVKGQPILRLVVRLVVLGHHQVNLNSN